MINGAPTQMEMLDRAFKNMDIALSIHFTVCHLLAYY